MSLSSSWPRHFENQQSNKLISSDTATEPLGRHAHQRFFFSSKPLFTQRRLTEHDGVLHKVSPGSCPVQTAFYWRPINSSTGAIWALSISLKAASVIDNDRRKWFLLCISIFFYWCLNVPSHQGIWAGDTGVDMLLRRILFRDSN